MEEQSRKVDQQKKRANILRTEIENNESRIGSMEHILRNKDDNLTRVKAQIGEALQDIQEQKYILNKLDGELSYFENENEQQKNAQSQLLRANEYEYVQGKENSIKAKDLGIAFKKLEQDEKSIGYEIDRLKQHSDQMLKD
jgi:chromosome segregation ATPase